MPPFIVTVLLSVSMYLAFGCTSLDPLSAAHGDQLEEDEQHLWKTVAKEERALDRSGTLYEDAAINRYVNEVMQRVLNPSVRSMPLTVKVKIVKNPLLNAFTFPNGVIYVHTGMLARIENEAQLATLLGHELTHATHRHTIQELRGIRRSSAVLGTFQVVTLPFGVFGLAATALGTVGHVAAVQGYSRGKENEADREGLALAVAAGYSPQEAPKLFEHLRRDLEARKIDEPFFFGTHPRLVDRVNSYRDLIEDRYASTTGDIGEERYQRTMIPLFLDNAKTDLAIGRFALAETSLGRVLRQGTQHSEALYLLGEICRQRNTENDGACSEGRYRESVAADPPYPEAHKALGLLLLKRGDQQGAKQELEQYLRYAPQAADRQHVEEELRRL